MVEVIFYGMKDCPANARQKQQLQSAGHKLVERDLATEPLTADTLRSFFGGKDVEQWFNRRAAAIRNGSVKPDALDAAGALAAMLADRDLIRRPLLEAEGQREAGFDPNLLNGWIGLTAGESCDSKHSRGQCDHGHQHFVKPPAAA